MSQQKPKTITLRRLEPGEESVDSDLIGPKRSIGRGEPLAHYREVSPIPEGYEVCDLDGATKVLIGDTWCDVTADRCIQDCTERFLDISRLAGFGVLAIRPIPEPEPTSGESEIETWSVDPNRGMTIFPKHLIGKRIRWEEVVKDGGE